MEAALSARSALLPRSSSLSGGAIAGAVVGSVVGAALIFICVLPFIQRYRRKRRLQNGDLLQEEMGQSPGGPIFTPRPQLQDATRRLSTDHFAPAPGHDMSPVNGHHSMNGFGIGDGQHALHSASPDQKRHPQPLLPPNVSLQQGLPSPVSSPMPSVPHLDTVGARHVEDGAAPRQSMGQEPLSPTSDAPESLHKDSGSTTGRGHSRKSSVTDSYGPPSRQLTGITTGGIVEEPEEFDHSSRHHHHFPHPHLPEGLQRLIHRASTHTRRRSTQTTDAPRSPTIGPGETLSHTESAPPTFEQVDTEAPGEAYSYYHPEDPVPVASRGKISVSAPLSPVSPIFDAGPDAGFVQEPEAISPDSDKTISPRDTFRTGTLLNKRFPGIQRMDTLPPAPGFVSDIPSPPLQSTVELSGLSGNPMDMMKPTNPTENAWMVTQEILKIENSPSPPAMASLPPLREPGSEPGSSAVYIKPDPSPEPEPEFFIVSPSPPEIEVNGHDIDMVDHSDFSTPPPSSGPSTENTPNTQATPYTASPSPDPDGQMYGQADASPREFRCEECHRVFDQTHKLNHHKRYHDRPHECPHEGCKMRFGTKTHLDRHINDKHNKTKKFHCTIHDCPYSRQGGKSFPRKDNWRRHMLNKHHITPPSEDPFEVTMGGT